jgi:chromosome segregation ATPase
MAEPNKEVEERLAVISTLEEQIKDLLEKKKVMVNEINKPIYKAKAEAEKIILEAKEKAKTITEEAAALKFKTDKECAKKTTEINSSLNRVNASKNETEEGKKQLEGDIANFNAAKFASESNLKEGKKEADKLMGQALALQNEAKDLMISANSKLSAAQKKIEDLQVKIDELKNQEASTKQQIEELRAVEKARADEKIELLALKNKNEEVLAGIVSERQKFEHDKTANQKILDNTKTALETLNKQKEEVDRKLNILSSDNDKLNEKKKSLNEKERSFKVLQRQIDEKISTLNKLRKEDKERNKETK